MNFKDIFTYRKRALKDNEDSIVVEINGAIDSKDRIFDIFYERFDVPGYAKNWDAFLDFFRDLDWVKEENAYIIHQELPNLNKKDLQIYIEIMYDALCDRAVGPFTAGPHLVIIFDPSDKDAINSMLSRYIDRKKDSPHYKPHPLGYY